MEYLKTTWADVRGGEKKKHIKTFTYITCPFCGFKVRYHGWSLAATGKRCPRCGALHANFGLSYRKAVSA